MSYYSDDEDLDVHIRHGARPVRYVQSPPRRSYYNDGPAYLVPEQHTTLVTRSHSRERSRSRNRYESPPQPSQAQPVIINNRIYKDHSSDDDDRQLARPRSVSRPSYMTRDEWENEQARLQLERMRVSRARDENDRRMAKEYRDEFELENAKRELDEIRKRETRAEEEKRIKRELELKRLKEEEEEAEEKKRREEEARKAVERYKQQEIERETKEKEEKRRNEEAYKNRLREDLVKSGLDEKAINAILQNQKVPANEKEKGKESAGAVARPTYTRMRRTHLSIETLRTFRIEYDVENDPEYVLIKRWVPEWEQDQLWKHTRIIREKREKTLMLEEKKHRRLEPEFEWVRKKERRRSKSPGLLTYLAGGRPG